MRRYCLAILLSLAVPQLAGAEPGANPGKITPPAPAPSEPRPAEPPAKCEECGCPGKPACAPGPSGKER